MLLGLALLLTTSHVALAQTAGARTALSLSCSLHNLNKYSVSHGSENGLWCPAHGMLPVHPPNMLCSDRRNREPSSDHGHGCCRRSIWRR